MSRTLNRPSNRRRTKLVPAVLTALLVLNHATGLVFAKEERRSAKKPAARRTVERRDASKVAERAADPKAQPADSRASTPVARLPGTQQPTTLRDRSKRSGLADRVAAGSTKDTAERGSRTSLKDRAGRKGLAERIAGRGQKAAPEQSAMERAKRPGARLADRVARKSNDRGDSASDGSHGPLPPRPKDGGGVKTTQEEPDQHDYVKGELDFDVPGDILDVVVENATDRLIDLHVLEADRQEALALIKQHPHDAKRLVQLAYLNGLGAPASWADLGLTDQELMDMVAHHEILGVEVKVPTVNEHATDEDIKKAAEALKKLEEAGKAYADGVKDGSLTDWAAGHILGGGLVPGGGAAWGQVDFGDQNPFDVYGEVGALGLPPTKEAIGDVTKWMNGEMDAEDILAKKEAGGYPEPKPDKKDDKGNRPGSSDSAPKNDTSDPATPGTPMPGASDTGDTGFQDAVTDLAGAVFGAVVAGIKWVESHKGLESPQHGFPWSASSKGEHVGSGWAPTKEEAEKQAEQAQKEHKEKQEKEKQEKDKQNKDKEKKGKEKEAEDKKKEKEEDSDNESEDNENESDEGAEKDPEGDIDEYTPGPDGPQPTPEQQARWLKQTGMDVLMKIRLDTELFDTKNGSKDSTPNPVGDPDVGTYSGSIPKGPGDINKDYVDTPGSKELSYEIAFEVMQQFGWKDNNGNGVIDWGPDYVNNQPGQNGGQPITDIAGQTGSGDGDGEATPVPPSPSNEGDEAEDDDEEAEEGQFAEEDDSEYVEIG